MTQKPDETLFCVLTVCEPWAVSTFSPRNNKSLARIPTDYMMAHKMTTHVKLYLVLYYHVVHLYMNEQNDDIIGV